MNSIGTLQETSLHAALKDWYAGSGGQAETEIDGYLIDLVREDELVEIQTGSFGAIKTKLKRLLADHQVRLVYPVARERWVVRQNRRGRQVARRKSPKRGRLEDIFDELVRIPHLASSPSLTLEVIFVQEEVVWRDDGKGSWRRKGWSVADRRLLSVLEQVPMEWPGGYLSLLPVSLEADFTNKDLARALKLRASQAQKMTYCLSRMGILDCIGRRGRYNLYAISPRLRHL